MNILIIGGTKFVGRWLVDAALKKGHTLTLFHRGQTNPDLYPQVERIIGDRDGGLEALGDRTWDAVIDTCGYVPRIVKLSADYLKGRVKTYAFISTISVYADRQQTGIDENGELATLQDETTEEITGETYGGLKVLCENVVQDTYPDGALIIRPGLIVGPHDPTNRFTYWPVRIRRGGDVLAPSQPDRPTQFIDARDLGEWTIRMVEQGATGIYNATGPDYRLTLGDVMQTGVQVTGADANFIWASDDFLVKHDVRPYMEMPLWIPGGDTFATINVQKAIAAGLTFRPLSNTMQATLDWVDDLHGDTPGAAGMAPEREADLLAKWQQR